MENLKKKYVRNTYTTLKKCLEDPDWLKAFNIIVKAQKNAIKNGLYSLYEDNDD